MTYEIIHGDCLDVLRGMEDDSVDAIVTDPPYGLSFMGKKWDYDVPTVGVWAECLRVLKPGGHLLAFAGTRTQHRMAVRIEDAGFEIRDTIGWIYGSGFPKSLNLGNGFGTALKPAFEPITLARKPLIGTVAENVLTHGTGALNIDGCRIAGDNPSIARREHAARTGKAGRQTAPPADNRFLSNADPAAALEAYIAPREGEAAGRWPANLIHDGSAEVVEVFPVTESIASARQTKSSGVTWSMRGTDRVVGHTDSGSAARFFYCAKADRSDREEGLAGMEKKSCQSTGWSGESMPLRQDGSQRKMPHARNHHPTVKPTDLMRYLCRLITPPGGLVLDPFAGSGSTGRGAVIEGFRFIGIEREADYCEIARKRIAAAAAQGDLFHEVAR